LLTPDPAEAGPTLGGGGGVVVLSLDSQPLYSLSIQLLETLCQSLKPRGLTTHMALSFNSFSLSKPSMTRTISRRIYEFFNFFMPSTPPPTSTHLTVILSLNCGCLGHCKRDVVGSLENHNSNHPHNDPRHPPCRQNEAHGFIYLPV